MENMKKTNEMLTASTFEVFEKMFFTFLEIMDDEGDDWAYDLASAIRFSGPQSGNMNIFLTSGMAATMAENMLGVGADEVSDIFIMDIAKEAINMICGNFLRKLDVSKVFDLTIPTYEKRAGEFSMKNAGEGNVIRLAFDSDADKMGVIVTFEN